MLVCIVYKRFAIYTVKKFVIHNVPTGSLIILEKKSVVQNVHNGEMDISTILEVTV